jgi:hypothetical protein
VRIGGDSQTTVKGIRAMVANVNDSHFLPGLLLHGAEAERWGESVYHKKDKVIASGAPAVQDRAKRHRRGRQAVDEAERGRSKSKARVRAQGEHPFLLFS